MQCIEKSRIELVKKSKSILIKTKVTEMPNGQNRASKALEASEPILIDNEVSAIHKNGRIELLKV